MPVGNLCPALKFTGWFWINQSLSDRPIPHEDYEEGRTIYTPLSSLKEGKVCCQNTTDS